MKLIYHAILLLALCCLTSSAGQAQQGTEAPLTNASVIKLIRAGFKEKTVVAIIHSRPNRFNLDPDHLIELKRSGVTENVILAMLSQDQPFSSTDDWSDDSFFRGSGRSGANGQADSQNGNSTDIFGSSGGSKNQSSGRGMKGSNTGETITTGSATVRILRPPVEAGGGSTTKLERTPTLDNEAIVRLVEAGFSEGTIIKRIEESPAEFDLSPPKLEELRKRRVSDAIILAMTAAMTDDSPAKPVSPDRN
ncbi:MAG TPA: hypothetical protein VE135_03070 [Pyrinomonadaceae bacterium]|nr:hypothetical protein [Pyrinomonadaceae bacterium]